jgi:hypothetical protein
MAGGTVRLNRATYVRSLGVRLSHPGIACSSASSVTQAEKDCLYLGYTMEEKELPISCYCTMKFVAALADIAAAIGS